MARSEIILGTPPTGIGGDTPRVASSKINAMTSELYQGVGTPAAPLPLERGGTGGTGQAGARLGLGLVPQTSQQDAIAGRLLTVGAFGLGGTVIMGQGETVSGSPSGFYTTTPSETAFNPPAGLSKDGSLINQTRAAAGPIAQAYQIWIHADTGRMFYRCGSNNTWQAGWKEVISSANLPAMIAGVPAGGVGSYGFFYTGDPKNPSDVVPGYLLLWASANTQAGSGPSGSWRCMAFAEAGGRTLFMRIS